MGGWEEISKVSFNFLYTLCVYRTCVVLLIYSKFFTNIVMGLKFWCQVGEFEFHFQNSYGEMCFWKIMLKVRCFKTTSDHRPFLSKFDVKLGSWGMIHTSEHRLLEVSTKPLPLPPGSSAGFTLRARSASLDPMRHGLRHGQRHRLRHGQRHGFFKKACHISCFLRVRWAWRSIKSVLQFSLYFMRV